MKLGTLNRIEGIGLIMILMSSFIQSLESGLSSSVQEYNNYAIQNKLDKLWYVNSKQYSQDNPEDSVHFNINFRSMVDNWKIYSQEREESLLFNNLIDSHEYWRILVFVLGSIMLIVPKFMEAEGQLKTRKENLKRFNDNVVRENLVRLARHSRSTSTTIISRHQRRQRK